MKRHTDGALATIASVKMSLDPRRDGYPWCDASAVDVGMLIDGSPITIGVVEAMTGWVELDPDGPCQ